MEYGQVLAFGSCAHNQLMAQMAMLRPKKHRLPRYLIEQLEARLLAQNHGSKRPEKSL